MVRPVERHSPLMKIFRSIDIAVTSNPGVQRLYTRCPIVREGRGDDGSIIALMLPAPETASSAQQVDATPRAARSLREAQAFCADLTRRHYENFPGASWIVPRRLRPAVQSIYSFARIPDDFPDEPAHEGRRLGKLEEWGGLLESCFAGEPFHPASVALTKRHSRHSRPLV